MDTVTLNVTGMVCGGCANTVRQALLALNGVVEVEVSHESGRAVVSFDPSKVTASHLEVAVRDAGYGITS